MGQMKGCLIHEPFEMPIKNNKGFIFGLRQNLLTIYTMDTAKFDDFDNKAYWQFSNPGVIEKNLQVLVGILNGVKSDNVINDSEKHALLAWVSAQAKQENKQPYKEVISLLRVALSDNILTHEEIDNITWFCYQYIDKSGYYTALTAGVQQLIGIVKGISIDNEINAEELQYLDNWLEENDYLKNTWPYDELYSLLTSILQDRVVTAEEHESLLSFCKAISSDSEQANTEFIAALKTGFYQIDPSIKIQENTFCITGLSKKYKRREIAEKIELYGGIVTDNVSSKLNYLVVCDEKNSCWAFTCYGRKIEEAMKHRKKGLNIVIVHEYDLYDTLEGMN